MKGSFFSKVLLIFFVAFLFACNVSYAKENLPQKLVYVDESSLVPLIKGYKRVIADIDSIQKQKGQELQEEYRKVTDIQGEMEDLRKLIREHENDIDFYDQNRQASLSDLQQQLATMEEIVSGFQKKAHEAQDEMQELSNRLLAPIKARYKSILDAFREEKKQKEEVSYIIIDKKYVASADSDSDITGIIEQRIKEDNARREMNIKKNSAGEPVSEKV